MELNIVFVGHSVPLVSAFRLSKTGEVTSKYGNSGEVLPEWKDEPQRNGSDLAIGLLSFMS
jgi:hypothetical protein